MSSSEVYAREIALQKGATIHRDVVEKVVTIRIGDKTQRFWMDSWMVAAEWISKQKPVKRGGKHARRR